jgi:hypothetical protein
MKINKIFPNNLFETASSIEFSDEIFLLKLIFNKHAKIECKAFISFDSFNQKKISYNLVAFKFSAFNIRWYILFVIIVILIIISAIIGRGHF